MTGVPPRRAAQERADSVALRFAWAPGLTAHVEQEFFRVRSTPQRTDSVTFRSTSRMRVLAHEKGLLVLSDSIVVPAMAGPDSGGARPGSATEGRLAEGERSFRGRLQRLLQLPA